MLRWPVGWIAVAAIVGLYACADGAGIDPSGGAAAGGSAAGGDNSGGESITVGSGGSGGECIDCTPCQAAEAHKSTVGCEYFTAPPDTIFGAGACFAAFIANTWSEPVTLSVSYGDTELDPTHFARIPSGSGLNISYTPLPNGEIPAGEIAILFLGHESPAEPNKPMCPPGIAPAFINSDMALHGTGIGQSFRIETSAPVVAYDIFPYGGGSSMITGATLLLPTSAWGDNYLAMAPYPVTYDVETFWPWQQIIAKEDDTAVTIRPTAAIVGGGGVAGVAAGQPITYNINRGEVLQLTQPEVLTGSPIESDKPVAVVGGNRCMFIPDVNTSACDAAHQMLPPVNALGHEYAAVRHRNRFPNTNESPPWQLLGTVDGTVLSYEPAPPPGAPTTINSGQRVQFSSSDPFVVRSQDADHPFMMMAHMTGSGSVFQDNDARGDPEAVLVIPGAQYLNEYVFFTDPTYPDTSLIFVRKRADDGTFADVTLDCLGTVTGWQTINADYEYARADLINGDFEPVGNCDNGRHVATSDGPFGLTVWGWGSIVTGGFPPPLPGFHSEYTSYAYPAGAGVVPISSVEVPAIPK